MRLVKYAGADVEQHLHVLAFNFVAGIANYVQQRLVGRLDNTIIGEGEKSAGRGFEPNVRAL